MGRGRHRWEWACLSVSLMLALRSGTICSILLMSPSAWRRAFRTSSRSISCTFRLRAISYKCHCNVMDVWWRVWGCRKPRGLVTHGASRPMLNFHCQTLSLTLVQGSRNHYPHKQNTIQKANVRTSLVVWRLRLCILKAGVAQVQALVRELDPACCNKDLVQPNK